MEGSDGSLMVLAAAALSCASADRIDALERAVDRLEEAGRNQIKLNQFTLDHVSGMMRVQTDALRAIESLAQHATMTMELQQQQQQQPPTVSAILQRKLRVLLSWP